MNGFLFSRSAGWCRSDGDNLIALDPELKHGLIPGFPEAKFNHPYPAGFSPRRGQPVPAGALLPDGLEAVAGGNPLQRYQEDYVPTAGWPLVAPRLYPGGSYDGRAEAVANLSGVQPDQQPGG